MTSRPGHRRDCAVLDAQVATGHAHSTSVECYVHNSRLASALNAAAVAAQADALDSPRLHQSHGQAVNHIVPVAVCHRIAAEGLGPTRLRTSTGSPRHWLTARSLTVPETEPLPISAMSSVMRSPCSAHVALDSTIDRRHGVCRGEAERPPAVVCPT